MHTVLCFRLSAYVQNQKHGERATQHVELSRQRYYNPLEHGQRMNNCMIWLNNGFKAGCRVILGLHINTSCTTQSLRHRGMAISFQQNTLICEGKRNLPSPWVEGRFHQDSCHVVSTIRKCSIRVRAMACHWGQLTLTNFMDSNGKLLYIVLIVPNDPYSFSDKTPVVIWPGFALWVPSFHIPLLSSNQSICCSILAI